jgi:hypothetical protein
MNDIFTPRKEHGQPSGCLLGPRSRAPAAARFLFTPSAVLPAQFFPPADGRAKGEVALMRAVLEDAVNCFSRRLVVQDRRTRRLAQEAEEWLFADDEHWPFSFVNICAVLGVNPEYLRRGLNQWRQQRPIPIPRRRPHLVSRPHYLRTAA